MEKNFTYLRVAAVAPEVHPGDVDFNLRKIKELYDQASSQHGARLVATPELSLSGYTAGDLFRQPLLLNRCREALEELARHTSGRDAAIVVGLPWMRDGKLINGAALCADGEVKGVIGKRNIPEYNEFYERRRFFPDTSAPLLFEVGGVKIGLEICEDLWVADTVSTDLALRGAEVIVNLSASNDLAGKYAYLKNLVKMTSARCICGYVYVSSGNGESSTDCVFSPKVIVAANGRLLAEAPRFDTGAVVTLADIDVDALRADRLNSSFRESRREEADTVVTDVTPNSPEKYSAPVERHPFVPADREHRAERCEEIISIQATGLAQRLRHIRATSLVVGISGGLDSTLALLIATRAFDMLHLDRKGIVGITMPGFGTTTRTKSNADTLMDSLGVTRLEIPIGASVKQHFHDIAHDSETHDITYENSQARERTQILMDYANKVNAIVLGTGDLSELALGWCTYNGDHMSMYGVNASVPKTLVRHLVQYFADTTDSSELKETLYDILDTPVSPELLPAVDDAIVQKTEDKVGPYELHDFFLYHFLRYARSPKAIYLLATKAFGADYDSATILKWLKTFFRRFFSQQFKRSCMPDGPKVGSVCLSPRGDWRMPSDIASAMWLAELEDIKP